MGHKKLSAAARRPAAPCVLAGLHRRREGRDLVQGIAVERVVDPTAVPAIGHQPGVLENSEMERQPRLRGVEYVLQFAHAPLSMGEEAHDLEARLVGERMEPAPGAGGVGRSGHGHGLSYISTNFDTSRGRYRSVSSFRCSKPDAALRICSSNQRSTML